MPKKSQKKVLSKQVVAEPKPVHHRRRWSLVVPVFSFMLLLFTISLAIYLRYFAYTVQRNVSTSDVSMGSSSSQGSDAVATPESKVTLSNSLLVVKTGSFVVTTDSASDAVQKISDAATTLKGSVVSSTVSDASTSCSSGVEPAYDMKVVMYPSYGCYDAYITIRVPAESYSKARDAILKVDENAKFDSETTQEVDVTTQASDLQTQLTSYKNEKASLESLLNSAKDIDDILKIRTELTQVQTQVQLLEQQIREINKNVQYAQLSVSVSTLASSSDVSSPSVSGRFAVAWAAMKQDISNLGTALIFVAVYAVIYVPLLIVLLIVFWLIKRAVHRHAK